MLGSQSSSEGPNVHWQAVVPAMLARAGLQLGSPSVKRMTIWSRESSFTSSLTDDRNARLAAVGVPPPVQVGPGGLQLVTSSSFAFVPSAWAWSVASSSELVAGSANLCAVVGPQPPLLSGSGNIEIA
jgi:hypothetical protein